MLQALCESMWLFIGARFITGCLGGSLTISYAYFADCVDKDDIPKYQSRLAAIISVAYVIGPLIGTSLVGIDLKFPLWFSGGIALIVLIITVVFLKEPTFFKEQQKNIELPEQLEVKLESDTHNINIEIHEDDERESRASKISYRDVSGAVAAYEQTARLSRLHKNESIKEITEEHEKEVYVEDIEKQTTNVSIPIVKKEVRITRFLSIYV